jgi:hypothetical protein
MIEALRTVECPRLLPSLKTASEVLIHWHNGAERGFQESHIESNEMRECQPGQAVLG